MTQKIIIESMAMDLKRMALGIHRGSTTMADRFKKEAFARSDELTPKNTSIYLKKLLTIMKTRLSVNSDRTADDALMLSTLFQNYILQKTS